ncbi:hypothetical protein HOD29_03955 [archaeon]|jgi:hypothetical protein|nr:hypothetical protein [archaeon]
MTSLTGKFLNNFEKIICYNSRKFIGNHEKTLEILFLSIYVTLQLILISFFPKTEITIIVITFLFFLSLERILVHIWMQEEKKKFELKEEKIKQKVTKLRMHYTKEINKLKKKR